MRIKTSKKPGNITRGNKTNHKLWLTSSIRQLVFSLLDENQYYSTREICELSNLPYRKYRKYIWVLRHEWKTNRENEQRLQCSIHGWRGWFFVPAGLDSGLAVERGWVQTKAKNRWLLWKEPRGRLKWFRTNRVDVWVRKPFSMAKLYQLIANAFLATDLINDARVLEEIQKSVKEKEAHVVIDVGQRLPRLKIRDFEKSHGFIVRLGDSSHPHAVEVELPLPAWAKRIERQVAELKALVKRLEERSHLDDSTKAGG